MFNVNLGILCFVFCVPNLLTITNLTVQREGSETIVQTKQGAMTFGFPGAMLVQVLRVLY